MKTTDKENIIKIDSKNIVNTYGRFQEVLVEGKGAVCTNAEGKEFIDFTSGIGVNSLGFANGAWVTAVCEQASKLQHISNLFYTEPQAKLAEILVARTGMQKVFFGNSGAEANECAIKTARKYGNEKKPGKNKIITLVNSFHGRTMASLTATGQDKYHKYFDPFVGGFEYCPANDFDTMKTLVDDDTCAVMMELIQGEGGVVPVEKDFVQKVENLCKEKDIILIIDEVQTGVGRTGTLFAYEQYDISPDIVTFAKGIGGGLPMGGALMGEKTCDVLTPGDHGTTFGGNPVCCSGAIAVLEQIDEKMLGEVAYKGELIRKKLAEIPKVNDITGLGLMIGFKVDGMEAKDVVEKAMAKGVLMLTAKDKVRLLPPLIISQDEITKGLDILKEIIG